MTFSFTAVPVGLCGCIVCISDTVNGVINRYDVERVANEPPMTSESAALDLLANPVVISCQRYHPLDDIALALLATDVPEYDVPSVHLRASSDAMPV